MGCSAWLWEGCGWEGCGWGLRLWHTEFHLRRHPVWSAHVLGVQLAIGAQVPALPEVGYLGLVPIRVSIRVSWDILAWSRPSLVE